MAEKLYLYFYLFVLIIAVATTSCSKKGDDVSIIDPVLTSGQKAPLITSFSPNVVRVGQTVTVNGNNFGSDVNAISIIFGNGTSIKPKSVAPTQLVFDVPVNATTGNFTVACSAGSAVSSTQLTVNYAINSFRLATNGGSGTVSGNQLTGTSMINDNSSITIRTNNTASGNIYETELVHAEKGTLEYISNTLIFVTFPLMNESDTTTVPYVRYTFKDDLSKNIIEYRAYIRNDKVGMPSSTSSLPTGVTAYEFKPGRLFLNSATADFPQNLTMADIIKYFKVKDQKIQQLITN